LSEEFKNLFSPIKLGGVTLKNRIIFLAHWTNYGNNHGYREDGLASERLAYHYIERAKGGAGLVCVTQSVSPTGQMGRTMVNAHDPRNEEVFRFMTSEIHKYGGKVFGQFNHCGHTSCMQRPPLMYAPTQMPGPHCYVNTKELEIDEMEEIKKYYVQAAVYEKEWGFDGVELKIAHDGLLRTFVSPYLNRRTDQYGGSFENRMRYPIEIIQAIREKVGKDYPIGIRLCMDEFTEWGYSWDYGVKMALALEEAGVDYINSDAGCFSNYNFEIPNNYIPMSFGVYMAAELKKVLKIPVVAFGRINDPSQAEDILKAKKADMIGMCRQLICDPETPNKILRGDLDGIRHCTACSEGCGMVSTQEGVVCIHNPAAGREKRLGIGTIEKAESPKKIAVIGAGIAGLKAAEIAAKRGHKVEVYEKSDKVGGQMLLAEKIPMRAEQSEVYRYLKMQLQQLNVPIIYNTEADMAKIHEIDPDVVVVATGSHPTLPEIDMSQTNITMLDPREAMQSIDKIGNKVVLVDKIGYWQAMGVADYISMLDAQVNIVTDRLYAGVDIEETCRENLNRRLTRKGAETYTSCRLKELRGKDVVLQSIFDPEKEIVINDVDTLVIAQESRSDNELYKELKKEGKYRAYVVGDAAAPGTVLRIIFDAEELGRRI
jgi:2,4-dienoyl-CoA reductase-like NADH-dependent reductase (Old Yellow Enzyme family)/thioredoxin reductase